MDSFPDIVRRGDRLAQPSQSLLSHCPKNGGNFSHRDVKFDDAIEAMQLIMLADRLIKIAEKRAQTPKQPSTG
jgi:hypothetical protein